MRAIIGLLFSAALLTQPLAAASAEQEIAIPLSVKGVFGESQYKLAATQFKPDGPGPFPLAIINHGSPRLAADRAKTTARYKAQSEALVARGFAVINPVRRGYGKSEGSWAEDYYGCKNPNYYDAGLETARDINAVIDYAKTQPDIDASRILVLGVSAGGFGSWRWPASSRRACWG